MLSVLRLNDPFMSYDPYTVGPTHPVSVPFLVPRIPVLVTLALSVTELSLVLASNAL